MMLIRGASASGRGLAWIARVSLKTKMPRLATFWLTGAGSGFSLLVAEVRKIDQSLRLLVSAPSSSDRRLSHASRIAWSRAAASSRRSASSSRGLAVCLATAPYVLAARCMLEQVLHVGDLC